MAPRRTERKPQKKKRWSDRKERAARREGRVNAICPGGGSSASPAGKTSYCSYGAAEAALIRIQREPDVPGQKKPCRVYVCDACLLYHLTSMEHFEPNGNPEGENSLEREAG